MTDYAVKRALQAKWMANHRARRKADGKCHDCSEKAIPGTARCETCRTRNRERTAGYDRRRLLHAWRPVDHAVGTDE